MNPRKPKLLFFQYQYNPKLPAFLLLHKSQHVQCLSHFFEVTVVTEDCDFSQLCDLHLPDLAIFEGGVPLPDCKRPRVQNVRARPEVLKAGLLNADAFCCSRPGFFSEMRNLGVDTFFAIACAAPDYAPEIAPNLIIWPNCVDPTLYRDYALPKMIPVLSIGNTNPLYPWRQKVFRRITERFPTLVCPHPGYLPSSAPMLVMHGERYARIINASFAVPSCGTAANEFVRKHIEIPACNALLVTEKTALLEAAGFVDMQNCLFVTESDAVEKLTALFADPDQLAEITRQGHQLAHSRHTFANRNQVHEWFTLRRKLAPGDRIVQLDPFQPLQVVRSDDPAKGHRVAADGLLIQLIHQAEREVHDRRYDDARQKYLRCLTIVPWMPEPKLGLARCSLLQGDAKSALSWILQPIQYTLAEYLARDPDPIEWQYLVIALLAAGSVRTASRRARQFPWLRRTELDRLRSFLNHLEGEEASPPAEPPNGGAGAPSIHDSPVRPLAEWAAEVAAYLRACGRHSVAGRLTAWAQLDPSPATAPQGSGDPDERLAPSELAVFRRGAAATSNRRKAREWVRDVLFTIERSVGYFLPYRLSSIRNDEFYSSVRALAADSRVTSLLIIGASPRRPTFAAAFHGAAENPNGPVLWCLATARNRHRRLQALSVNGCAIRSRLAEGAARGGDTETLNRAIAEAVAERKGEPFSLVLIDSAEIPGDSVPGEILGQVLRAATRAVVIAGTYTSLCQAAADDLRREGLFHLAGLYDSANRGNAILLRTERPAADPATVDWSAANAATLVRAESFLDDLG